MFAIEGSGIKKAYLEWDIRNQFPQLLQSPPGVFMQKPELAQSS
jgi:hypothetical protein